ncbi:MAG: SufD family Fe-S cluster assembly protein [Paludibacteraceae bacterium]|jgi:Fe-S cluster assembly protein SufD|nr:SufD family Fe-S cluster assembly protein [Paludibacteraceae bacterium]
MNEITIHSGETFERVFLNEPNIDLRIVQEADSRVKIHVLNMPFDKSINRYTDMSKQSCFQETKNNITVSQQGTGCSTEIYGLAYLRGDDHVETETHVFHRVGGGESKQLFKFVLADRAQGAFYGELQIAKDAQQTRTEQVNRNLLLSREAQMRTRPQLEIYADDVQASHGATTGQLDESALFYMQQRGISREVAYRMLVAAFLKDVLEKVPDNEQREHLMDTIDRVVE